MEPNLAPAWIPAGGWVQVRRSERNVVAAVKTIDVRRQTCGRFDRGVIED